MPLTIEIPDYLAEQLAAFPDVNAFATAALEPALMDGDDGEETDEIDEEAVAAIAEGIADIEAG